MSCFSLPVLSSPVDEGKIAAIDELFVEFDSKETPGMAVGIYQDGNVLYTNGFGIADLEQGSPITADTIFHVASISKQFTAFSVALLAKEKKLDLDEDIRAYLPYVPVLGQEITVRHLLYHTSGLRDQWSLFGFGGQNRQNHLSQSQIINMVSKQRELNFVPGTEWSYSNTGYTLLAEIVEAVSGKSLREFTAERIFRPLEMKSTFFYDDLSELVPGRANSYYYSKVKDSWRRDSLNFNNYGATSLHTTVGDLLKWAENLSNPKIGDQSLIRQITSTGHLDDGSPLKYGFGLMRLMRMNTSGHEAIGHLGRDSGYMGIFLYVPNEDFAVVILGNASEDPRSRAWRIVELFLGEGPVSQNIPAAAEERTALISELPGRYLAAYGKPLIFEKSADRVVSEGREVVVRVDGTFDFGDDERPRSYFRPLMSREGKVEEFLRVDEMGQTLKYRRSVYEVDKSKFTEFVGDYYSHELDVTYTVALQGRALQLTSLWFRAPILLEPVEKDRFSGKEFMEVDGMEGDIMETVLFTRNKDGKVNRVEIGDNGRARHIRFERRTECTTNALR